MRRRNSNCPAATVLNLEDPAVAAAEWAGRPALAAVAWVDLQAVEEAEAWVGPVAADQAAACPR
jgi:hypothetical protein